MARAKKIPSHRVRVIRDTRDTTSTEGLEPREVKIHTLAFVVGPAPENPEQWWRENDRSRWLEQ